MLTREQMTAMSSRDLVKHCQQQRDMGRERFGMYPNNATKPQLIAFIELCEAFYSQTQPATTAPVQNEPAPAEVKPGSFKQIAPKARKEIRFHSTDTESYPVSLSHNFRRLTYKRGVWLPIEDEYINVLRDTVIKTFKQDPQTGERTEILVPRFTYDLRDIAA
jgi:hypothetical protein